MDKINPFAQWLVDAREKSGVSRRALAQKFGISDSTLKGYEHGFYVAKPAIYAKLAKIIGNVPSGLDEWMRLHALEKDPCKRRVHKVDPTPFSLWVKAERGKLNLTQKQFASRIGLSLDTYGSVERGARFVSKKVLERIQTLVGKMPPDTQAWAAERYRLNLVALTSNKSEEDSPFGRILRAERHRRTITRKELALLIGISHQHIQRLEDGCRAVSMQHMQKIAKAFGYKHVPQQWKDIVFESGLSPYARSSVAYEELPPLGQLLRRLRHDRGLSVEDIANKMGIASVTISGYESGKNNISDIRLNELAMAYGLPQAPKKWFHLRKLSSQDPQPRSGELNNSLTHFGRLLRSCRQDLGVSQTSLSKALGKEGKYVCCLEYGQITLTPKTVKDIVDCLGVPEMLGEFYDAIDKDGKWRTSQELADEHLTERGRLARNDRRAMGLRQIELAAIEGVSESTISRRETERPTWKAMLKEEGEA